MRLTYWASACVTIEHQEIKILCDPWLGLGNNWDGSWGLPRHLPPPEWFLTEIGRVDAVYISHLHDDHYAPRFFQIYEEMHNCLPIILAPDEPHLRLRLKMEGLAHRTKVCSAYDFVPLDIKVFRAFPEGHREPIDSALALRAIDTGESIVNLNDCPYDPTLVQDLLTFCGEKSPTLACLPYLGAGEYPHTYIFPTPEEQAAAAAAKRDQYLRLFQKYVSVLLPRYALPFAGEYELQGPLAALNPLRGLPDALDAVDLLSTHVATQGVALRPGGSINLTTGVILGQRRLRLDDSAPYVNTMNLSGNYRYARDLSLNLTPQQLGRMFVTLTKIAAAKASDEFPIEAPFTFYFGPKGGEGWWAAVEISSGKAGLTNVLPSEPREEVRLDPRHFLGLLLGLYRWNVAQGGSHMLCRRVPNVFRREVYEWQEHFHI